MVERHGKIDPVLTCYFLKPFYQSATCHRVSHTGFKMNHECSLSLIPGSVNRIQSLDRNWALTHWTPTLKFLMPIFIFSSLLLLLWHRSMGPWRSCGLISSSLPHAENRSQRGGEITPGIHRFFVQNFLSVSTSTDFYPIICFVKSSWTIIQLLKQCLTCSQYLINTFWLSEWISHQPILPGTLRQTSSTVLNSPSFPTLCGV